MVKYGNQVAYPDHKRRKYAKIKFSDRKAHLTHKGHNRPHNIWTRMENHTIQHGPKPSHLKTTSWNREPLHCGFAIGRIAETKRF